MYKLASKLGLRFSTVKGLLSAEQLWQLTQADLARAIKAIKKVLKKDDDDELSFLTNTKTADTINQLKFDILKDIYLTKKKDSEDLRNIAENKAHNQKILSFIADKQEEGLKSKTIEELEALLK